MAGSWKKYHHSSLDYTLALTEICSNNLLILRIRFLHYVSSARPMNSLLLLGNGEMKMVNVSPQS